MLLLGPLQMIWAQDSSDKYVVVRIKRHDKLVSVIDVRRNHSTYRIYSIIREPIDSTYCRLHVGDSFAADLISLQDWFIDMNSGIMTSFTILYEIYPRLCIGEEPPRFTVGEYLCPCLNGRYIKKEGYPPCPVSLDDFFKYNDNSWILKAEEESEAEKPNTPE